MWLLQKERKRDSTLFLNDISCLRPFQNMAICRHDKTFKLY